MALSVLYSTDGLRQLVGASLNKETLLEQIERSLKAAKQSFGAKAWL